MANSRVKSASNNQPLKPPKKAQKASNKQSPNAKKYSDVGNWPAWRRGDHGISKSGLGVSIKAVRNKVDSTNQTCDSPNQH